MRLFAVAPIVLLAILGETAKVALVTWCPDSGTCDCDRRINDQYVFREDTCYGDGLDERHPGGVWRFRGCTEVDTVGEQPVMEFFGSSGNCDGTPLLVTNMTTDCQLHGAWLSPNPVRLSTGSFRWRCANDRGRWLYLGWTCFALLMLCCIGVCVCCCLRKTAAKEDAAAASATEPTAAEQGKVPMHLLGEVADGKPASNGAEDEDGDSGPLPEQLPAMDADVDPTDGAKLV